MALDIAAVIRLKGAIDALIEQAPAEGRPRLVAAPAVVDAYLTMRRRCSELVAGSEVETEFHDLFPEVAPLQVVHGFSDTYQVGLAVDRARLLLGQLSGWLGSFPSAEALLADLIAALEQAEALSDEPAERERLAGVLSGLRGAGRQIAIDVIAAYLSRQI